MSVLLLQTGGTDNLLLQAADNLLLQDSGAGTGGPFPWHMDDMSGGLQTLGVGL